MGCASCLKCFFIFMNAILLIVGGASLGIGIWLIVDSGSFLYLTQLSDMGSDQPSLVKLSGYIMIGAGGGTILFAIIGIIGAARNIKCLLAMYIGLVVLALVVEVSAVVLGVIFRQQMMNSIETKLVRKIEKDYEGSGDNVNDFSKDLNSIMTKSNCCGIVDGLNEFRKAENWAKGTKKVPEECCQQNASCTKSPNSHNINKGCMKKIQKILFKYHAVVIGIAAGVAGFQFFLIILAACTLSASKKGYPMSSKL